MQSLVCPLDFRYGREEIKKVFSEEAKLNYLLKVEAALAKAHAEVGNIPKSAADEISKKASSTHVSLDRVKELERETKHDIMALTKALAEVCEGEAKKYIHLGATSYDIVDTANALQFREALSIVYEELKSLRTTLLSLAKKYRDTIMLGRTHGQHTIPITFGLKMAVYAMEVNRQMERLEDCKKRLLVGKMSGAVGTGAALGKHAKKIQEIVMRELGLGIEIAATQIVGRDRYVELANVLANIATSMEKFATEIRNLQRSEIGEVAEAFDIKKQVGSSTMPHKMNPITCEQICGLARIVRALSHSAYDNAIQWHERDLCNSSSERFWIPHCFILTDWIVYQMNKVLFSLRVFPDRMKENIERAKGIPMAESVMILLVSKGLARDRAHEIVRRCAIRAHVEAKTLFDSLKQEKDIESLVSDEELKNALDPKNYIGRARDIVDEVVEKLSR
ncbi:MAG TPA: adenylosuccinate lyase [Thermoplasmatales archaeon]|nr:adenylosuccinate lyase [Thermoplasmatales archaeon]